jgi:hypothetical protein
MDNRVKFVDFLQAVKGIQDLINKENEERVVHNINENEWDLIHKLTITPTNLQLETDYSIIEFDTNLNIIGKIRRKKTNE